MDRCSRRAGAGNLPVRRFFYTPCALGGQGDCTVPKKYSSRDALKLSDDRRASVEGLMEAGFSNSVIGIKLKLPTKTVAQVRHLWSAGQTARVREQALGGHQEPPEVVPKPRATRDHYDDEDKRRGKLLGKARRTAHRELPVEERIKLLATIARVSVEDGYVTCPKCKAGFRANVASAAAGMAAIKELNELDGVKGKGMEPTVPVQQKAFEFPADAQRPAITVPIVS
jgi:hypothetical protein